MSDFNDSIKEISGNVYLNIEVNPNSKEFSIYAYNTWRNRFQIRIKSPPQKGKANKEIVKEFSNIFKKDIEIDKGDKSSQKTLIIYNISKEEVLRFFNSLNID